MSKKTLTPLQGKLSDVATIEEWHLFNVGLHLILVVISWINFKKLLIICGLRIIAINNLIKTLASSEQCILSALLIRRQYNESPSPQQAVSCFEMTGFDNLIDNDQLKQYFQRLKGASALPELMLLSRW